MKLQSLKQIIQDLPDELNVRVRCDGILYEVDEADNTSTSFEIVTGDESE